jgi:hypothetical protein
MQPAAFLRPCSCGKQQPGYRGALGWL